MGEFAAHFVGEDLGISPCVCVCVCACVCGFVLETKSWELYTLRSIHEAEVLQLRIMVICKGKGMVGIQPAGVDVATLRNMTRVWEKRVHVQL